MLPGSFQNLRKKDRENKNIAIFIGKNTNILEKEKSAVKSEDLIANP